MSILGVDVLTMAATLVVWAFFGIPIKNAVLGVWRRIGGRSTAA
jgi:hypothetical protein